MKILLVDDHVLFREGVASLLDTQPDMEVLGESACVQEAVAKARDLKPDVILMDISLPDGSGVEAARQILAEQPDIKIIFLTVHEDDERLFDAIKSGGQGYLLKNMRTSELLDLLRGLDRGEAAISRQMGHRIMVEFARMRTRLESTTPNISVGEDVALTNREIDVLKLVAGGASNKGIAEKLVVTESTVKNHMSNILHKLHLKNRREAAAYARRHGLIPPSKN